MIPKRIHTVLISTQHNEDVSNEQIRKDLREKVCDEVLPKDLVDKDTKYFLNPSNRFVIGGFFFIILISRSNGFNWKKDYC
jgi:S-adenosylmethionine synthetase